VHTPNGDGGPPKKFKSERQIGLKIQGVSAYNFGASGSNDVPRGRDVNVGTNFGEGLPPKIWEGKKTSKIRRDF